MYRFLSRHADVKSLQVAVFVWVPVAKLQWTDGSPHNHDLRALPSTVPAQASDPESPLPAVHSENPYDPLLF
ncbi:hypothetical protein D3C74_445770 [compost metagenome]